MFPASDIQAESTTTPELVQEHQSSQHPAKRVRIFPSPTVLTERADPLGVRRTSSGPQELTSPNSATRESTRLRNKAVNTLKAKQEAHKVQLDTEAFSNHPSQTSQQYVHPPDRTHGSIQSSSTLAAAQAAQRVKHACTIDEDELLALRPTLLMGYAATQDHSRSEALEADLKSLLYYFRHHTVEPDILKRLCFVELVYMLQHHANRLVADLAAQLITLGPWKVVYDQLQIMNGPWFDQHATKPLEQLAGKGGAAAASAVPVAAALQKQNSGL